MKKLLNTLFVTTEDAYLSLDGENIVVSRDRHELGRFPLHTLSAIISFSYAGAHGRVYQARRRADVLRTEWPFPRPCRW